jgi:hypothetical protein
MTDPKDPRSVDEKARADLARNDALGLAVPESEAEARPSVTNATFGVHEDADRETGPVDRKNRDDPLPQAP